MTIPDHNKQLQLNVLTEEALTEPNIQPYDRSTLMAGRALAPFKL